MTSYYLSPATNILIGLWIINMIMIITVPSPSEYLLIKIMIYFPISVSVICTRFGS